MRIAFIHIQHHYWNIVLINLTTFFGDVKCSKSKVSYLTLPYFTLPYFTLLYFTLLGVILSLIHLFYSYLPLGHFIFITKPLVGLCVLIGREKPVSQQTCIASFSPYLPYLTLPYLTLPYLHTHTIILSFFFPFYLFLSFLLSLLTLLSPPLSRLLLHTKLNIPLQYRQPKVCRIG